MSSRNLGTKSGLKKFDMVPESPATLPALIFIPLTIATEI